MVAGVKLLAFQSCILKVGQQPDDDFGERAGPDLINKFSARRNFISQIEGYTKNKSNKNQTLTKS